MIGWLRHHKHALAAALRRLGIQPFTTLLTALAMGVAISLPSGLYLGLDNLSRVAGGLPAQPEISLFLDAGSSAEQKQAIAARLKLPDIAQARFVPKDEALASPRYSPLGRLIATPMASAVRSVVNAWVPRRRSAVVNACLW